MENRKEDIRQRVNIREIYRYLGYGAKTPDDNVVLMVMEVLAGLLGVIQPRYIYKRYACSASEAVVVLKGSDGRLPLKAGISRQIWRSADR